MHVGEVLIAVLLLRCQEAGGRRAGERPRPPAAGATDEYSVPIGRRPDVVTARVPLHDATPCHAEGTAGRLVGGTGDSEPLNSCGDSRWRVCGSRPATRPRHPRGSNGPLGRAGRYRRRAAQRHRRAGHAAAVMRCDRHERIAARACSARREAILLRATGRSRRAMGAPRVAVSTPVHTSTTFRWSGSSGWAPSGQDGASEVVAEHHGLGSIRLPLHAQPNSNDSLDRAQEPGEASMSTSRPALTAAPARGRSRDALSGRSRRGMESCWSRHAQQGRQRSRSRPITIRWIWLVPSKIWVTLASRNSRSTGYSRV